MLIFVVLANLNRLAQPVVYRNGIKAVSDCIQGGHILERDL